MARRGVKATSLSLQIGSNRTLVKDLLEKNRDVQVSTLAKLAGALDVPFEELLERRRVPIAGHIGAGGVVLFEPFDGETAESYVIRPPGISGDIVALIVRGDSMLPKYQDGDIIYIQKVCEGVLPDYIGSDCAVHTADGATYIKQLDFGSAPGLYTLRSLNAADMRDVQVVWATPVLFIMPRRAREMIE